MVHFLEIVSFGGRAELTLIPGQRLRGREIVAPEPVKDPAGLLKQYPVGTVLVTQSLRTVTRGRSSALVLAGAEPLDGEPSPMRTKWRKAYAAMQRT